MESSPAGCRYRPGMPELRATGAITSPPACPQGETHFSPLPLSYLPKWYPYMVRFPEVWGFNYRISNGTRRARVIVESAYPYVRRSLHKVINQSPSDMIVSLHPLANDPFLHALGKHHPPFITVVTDLVTTHALWYHKGVDLCLVPP